jgi:hypothetical protein
LSLIPFLPSTPFLLGPFLPILPALHPPCNFLSVGPVRGTFLHRFLLAHAITHLNPDLYLYQLSIHHALQPWRWRQHGPPKHWCPTTKLHGTTTQKTLNYKIQLSLFLYIKGP